MIVVGGVSMKRLCAILVMLLVLVSGCGVQKTEPDSKNTSMIPDCVVSNSSNDDYSLTIIANRSDIEDKEAFAEQLIEQVKSNGFKRIMFSFEETGYPTGLLMTVYLTEEDWQDRDTAPYMNVSFRQESVVNGFNIMEHYDQFQLKIDCEQSM